jgi:P-type Ca2+ transporter type 2C
VVSRQTPTAAARADDAGVNATPAGRTALSGLTGLDEAQVAERRLAHGRNEIPQTGGRNLLRIITDTLREPMFLLLLAAAGIYLMLGDLAEGLFLTAGAAAAIGLVILQEARSERALRALRDLAQPQARVIRAGVEHRIPSADLVPDDILLVGEGERMPVDGLLVAGDVLSVDEAALTGESAPVSKRLAEAGEGFGTEVRPGADLTPYLFAGALVVRGQGVIRVARTGPASALGQIGGSLARIEAEPTPLQRTAGRLVALLGGLAVAFCGLVAVSYGLLRNDWIGGLLAGITVAIALIPEEFPMVLAVFMALGAWRLATHKVLVRRSAVVETLGAATVLCVDKTGTLTENKMQVARIWTPAGEFSVTPGVDLAAPAAELMTVAGFASAVRPVDPMDRAIQALLSEACTDSQPAQGEPERAWPLRPELMAVVQVWRGADNGRFGAAKGAPEAIFKLCRMSGPDLEGMHAVVHRFAEQGLRVLGVAAAQDDGAFPDDPLDAPFRFAGLLGFVDPLRADVPAALAEARAAGIAVMMITGDHPSTALAIARAAGIDTTAGALLGVDLAALSMPALRERLRSVRVFARVAPEQKLLIVEALKADGQVVAMTGDGINDAPALEAAHIGVAMGRKGTDVAREAADLVLQDDSFASIVGGVRLGRRIFANLRRALTYVTAIHVPIAGIALAPILVGWPQLLFPMHVVLLELAIDPICALVFEGEPSERAAMRRPPRPKDEPLFGPAQIGLGLVQGAGVLVAVLALYAWALATGPEREARGAAFVTLVVGNLTLALADAASREGRLFASYRWSFWAIAAVACIVLALALGAPGFAAMFQMAPPTAHTLIAAVLAGLAAGGWYAVAVRLRPQDRTTLDRRSQG